MSVDEHLKNPCMVCVNILVNILEWHYSWHSQKNRFSLTWLELTSLLQTVCISLCNTYSVFLVNKLSLRIRFLDIYALGGVRILWHTFREGSRICDRAWQGEGRGPKVPNLAWHTLWTAPNWAVWSIFEKWLRLQQIVLQTQRRSPLLLNLLLLI